MATERKAHSSPQLVDIRSRCRERYSKARRCALNPVRQVFWCVIVIRYDACKRSIEIVSLGLRFSCPCTLTLDLPPFFLGSRHNIRAGTHEGGLERDLLIDTPHFRLELLSIDSPASRNRHPIGHDRSIYQKINRRKKYFPFLDYIWCVHYCYRITMSSVGCREGQ